MLPGLFSAHHDRQLGAQAVLLCVAAYFCLAAPGFRAGAPRYLGLICYRLLTGKGTIYKPRSSGPAL
mgnify:CR=1 FL=1